MRSRIVHFKYKIILSFFLVALISSLFMGIFHYFNMKQNLESTFKSYRDIMESNLLNVTTDTDQLYLTIERMLDPEAESILNKIRDDYGKTGSLPSNLKRYLLNHEKFQLYIINEKNVVVDTTEETDSGLDFNKYPDFVKELKWIRSEGVYYSQRMSGSVNMLETRKYGYLPSGDEKYIFEIGYRIQDYIEYVEGVGFEKIQSKLTNINNTLNSVTVYNGDGFVFKTQKSDEPKQISKSHMKQFQQAVSSMKTVEFTAKENGLSLIYQYIPFKLKDTGIQNNIKVVEVIYNHDWLTRQLTVNFFTQVSLFFIVVLIVMLFGNFIAKLISRPIEQLVASTKEFSSGNYDHKAYLNVSDEFLLLSESMNNMAENIKIREEHLNNKNQEIHALYEQTQAMNDSLTELVQANDRNYMESMGMICGAIEAKDSYTRGHSERVKNISVAIATEMGLSSKELRSIERGSMLHDVGKIGVPEHILNKATRLSDEEFDVIKRHPDVGYQILKGWGFLSEGLEIIREHHERYDGKGYPQGLKSEEISMLARIVSVADAYDAMTSSRSYRKTPMEQDKAVEEIMMNAGKQFDPDVANAFQKCIEKYMIQ